MKYHRKQPVEAIQWRGDNQKELSEFMGKVAKNYCTKDDGYGNLYVCYTDNKNRKHVSVLPKFGWIVVEGKMLQFYTDDTFYDTFVAVTESASEAVWPDTQKLVDKFGKAFEDNYQSMLDKWLETLPFYANKLQKYAVNEKDVESDTFDSVLDEMRDLHAKKNADYGDAAHVNFLKYGPVASLSRLSEKMQRAEHIFLSGKNEVKDEPLTATLIDMAITSAMLYMELKNSNDDKL